MTNFASRLLVAAVGLPLVLGMLWLGGWWLFGLLAVAACVGLHEFVTTARPMRPLAPAVYGGVLLALVGALQGGVVWLVAGFFGSLVPRFIFHALSSTRAPTTAAVGSTILGSAWVGLGLGFLLLLRQMHDHGRLIAFAVVLAAWAAATFAYFGGRVTGRHKLCPRLPPGQSGGA